MCKFSSNFLEHTNKLWNSGRPAVPSHARHTHSPTRMCTHAHTVCLKVNNLLMEEKKQWEGFSFLPSLFLAHSRTWGRTQLSPMELANTACLVREQSTTVALTPLSARTMAACLAISQYTGLLLVESYTNHFTSRTADRTGTYVTEGEGQTTMRRKRGDEKHCLHTLISTHARRKEKRCLIKVS